MILSLRLAARQALLAGRPCPPIGATASTRRALGLGSVRYNMYTPISFTPIDPMKIFDEMDIDGNGVISREEFASAVERMHYSDLVKLNESVLANQGALEAKIAHVESIERNMETLKETYKKKRQAYNNVGWMTADEIEVLFDDAATKKEEISASVAELKVLLTEAKKTYAVEAPDGHSDAEEKKEMEEVNRIINESASRKA